ncbi:MAG: GNAT family N-acetyltransferase [Minicystis sp.]
MSIEIRPIAADRIAELMTPIGTAFGIAFTPLYLDRARSLTELDVRIGAYDGDTIVGAAGSFTFDMTVPGPVPVETAGLTLVAVVPTHRRQGVLRSLMREHLDGARARGQVMAGLWASEGPIYGRFGYGMAAVAGDVELPRDRTAFIGPAAPPWRARFLSEEEAMVVCPPIWDAARRTTVGMVTRSPGWWRARRLANPEGLRAGRGPLQRVLLEIDGRPAAYALYRFAYPVPHREPLPPIDVHEAMATSPGATRAIWRYLLDIDLAPSFRALQLSPDHPLLHMLADPRRLGMRLRDSVWVRLVDVAAALSKRGYSSDGRLVIEVEDTFCPWNTGCYRIAGGVAERTGEAPDLAMGVSELSAAYMGGVSFSALAAAGRVIERREGALEEGDRMFRTARLPWCPETF